MKLKISILLGLVLLGGFGAKAQKMGATPEDSVTCIQNVSLYQSNFKQKNYEDALKNMWVVIGVCPASKYTKAIYQRAPKIYAAKIKNAKKAKNDELKEQLIDSCMLIYDLRMKHFGQKGLVLEKKASDHLKFRPKQPEVAYAWFEEAFKLRGNKMGAGAIVYMFKARYDMFKQGKCEKSEVIDLYPKMKAIADFNIKNSKKEKRIANYKTSSENLLQIFKEVASCEDLETAFKPRFEANPNDVEATKGILELLNAKECDESDFYIAVAKKYQELQPSALAAFSIANWYVKKGDCKNAIDFYLEAFALADSMDEAEKAPFKIKASIRAAYCYLSNGQYAKAKLMAQKALAIDNNIGEAYMIIGDAYAGGASSWGDNECTKRAGYWAAVDKYHTALAKDPELKAKIGPKISRAKSRFPEKQECFFHTINEGSSVTVGGWINETVKVRFN